VQLTHFRFEAAKSRVTVTAHAPGHRFRVHGAGIEGEVTLSEARIERLSARFPLEALQAGDPLGNRELRRFLSLDQKPRAEAELIAPADLDASASGPSRARARVRFSLGRRTTESEVTLVTRRFSDRADGEAKLSLSFSGLGYAPPKLLFFKVKDALEIEINAALTLCGEA
jgi:hypothetical protein